MKIYDGNSSWDMLLAHAYNKLDSSYNSIQKVASSGNEMLVTFSSSANVATGFYAKIQKTLFQDRDPLAKFCTMTNQCRVNEGNCYHDQQCSKGLKCGKNNCPIHSGYANGTNCCYEHCNDWLGEDYLGEFIMSRIPGTIVSYPENTECSWTITAPANKRVTLTFQYFLVSLSI